MRRASLWALAVALLAGTASVGRDHDSASVKLGLGTPAEALLFKRAFRRIKGSVKRVGKGIKKGAKTIGKGIKKGVKTIRSVGKKVVDGVKKVAGKVMGALGLPLLLKLAKPALSFLLKKGCGGIIDLIVKKTGISAVVKKLGGAFSFAGKCASEFVKAFVCSVPNIILDAANLIKDVVKSTWKHKVVCLPMTLLAGVGPQMIAPALGCGAGFYVIQKVKKAISCLGKMKEMPGGQLTSVFKSLAMQGCSMAGDIAFDIASGILITVLTSGGGFAAVIAKVLLRAQKVIGMIEKVTSVVGQLKEMGSCK